MSSVSTSIKHLVLLALPAWGHVRPLLILATRLVLQRDDIFVTVLLPPNVIEKAHSDISNQFRKADASKNVAQDRIRIVATFSAPDNVDFFNLVQPFAESYSDAYESLLQSKPITCATTGTVFDALPPPTTIIMDFFALGQLQATRAKTGRTVPVVAFISAGSASVIRLFGPESIGGRGDIGAKTDAEVARTGRDALEVGEEIYRYTDGSVVEIPGLPPMYDYEFYPQILAFGAPSSPIIRGGYTFFQECDAVIVQTNSAYDNSGSLTALKSWLHGSNQGAYGIGPLLPLGYGTEDMGTRGDTQVEGFMEEMHKTYGDRSVTFISFGTLFWPASPEYVEELIDAFIEKKAPFFFCHASPLANLPEEFFAKVKACGFGYTSKWAPQQYILNHPATGWFLTHGGQGGITESLGSGIPMICWPFEADQPASAAHLTENLKVAIELFEVRTGEKGVQPMLRNGRSPKGTREAVKAEIKQTIDITRGPKGQELRRNAEKMKEAFINAWTEDGEATKEISAFLDKYL